MGKKRRIFATSGPVLRTDPRLIEHLSRLYPSLTTPAGMRKLSEAMHGLHTGLTVNRHTFVGKPYLDQADHRFAYDTYMLSVQSPKLGVVLDSVSSLLRQCTSPLNILDIGCGTGTASIAASLWMNAHHRPITLTCIDHSRGALARAKRHLDTLHSGRHTMVHTESAKLGDTLRNLGEFDLCIMMNVVNELRPEQTLEIESKLRRHLRGDGFLIVIEPSAKEPARKTMAFRDYLVAQNWSVVRPCPNSHPCPMSKRQTDWCHDTWRYERPEFVSTVDQSLGLRREVLKATWFVLAPPTSAFTQEEAPLVVGEQIVEKGRSLVHVCDGVQVLELELQRKDRSGSNLAFEDVARYDRIRFDQVSQKGPRTRLSPESTVTISPLVRSTDEA